jgi:hypothetical protein
MTPLQPVSSFTPGAPHALGELPFDDSTAFARADAHAGTWSFSLGYGRQWDTLLQHVLDAFLSGFENIPVTVQGQALHVHPPYLINVDNERLRRARQHRLQATGSAAALPGGLQRAASWLCWARARRNRCRPSFSRWSTATCWRARRSRQPRTACAAG